MNLNRVVAIVSVLISLALAVLPVLLNFDWTSTAGIIGGIIGVLAVTQKWLDGWQKHEERIYGQKVKVAVTTDTESDEDPEFRFLDDPPSGTLPPDEGDPGPGAVEEQG